jgi:hypothetical protein
VHFNTVVEIVNDEDIQALVRARKLRNRARVYQPYIYIYIYVYIYIYIYLRYGTQLDLPGEVERRDDEAGHHL